MNDGDGDESNFGCLSHHLECLSFVRRSIIERYHREEKVRHRNVVGGRKKDAFCQSSPIMDHG